MKKKKLEGKIAVISGGSSGIGLAISKRLFDEGVKVINISRKKCENNIFAESFSCDITDEKNILDIFKIISEKYKKIDFLFCNAGMGIAGLLENASIESIDKIMNVNLIAHIKMTNIFLPIINDGGKILYTGSLGGFIPLPYQACYSATKAGVEFFARALATEIKPRKIKVTVFMPGDTKTGFTDARVKETSADAKEKQGIDKMEKAERGGKDPDYVAKRVVAVLKKKNPPRRLPIGGTGKLLNFCVKVLPARFVDWLVEKLYV